MQYIKSLVEQNSALLKAKFATLRWMHWLDYLRRKDPNEVRMVRSKDVFRTCLDWERIEKCPEAGRVLGGFLYMHNGLRVLPTAYNGYAHSKLIQHARGIHEPQEERLFGDVLPHVSEGATIIELGAFWSFYSMWFLKQVKNGKAICVEPELSHLNYGKYHMKRNELEAKFVHAFAGEKFDDKAHIPIVSVDWLVDSYGIERVGILHSDIQGYELDMLKGAQKSFCNRKIEFAFISTHSQELHESCRRKLVEFGMHILADVPLEDSWNPDGVLVAQQKELPVFDIIPPHLKRDLLL